MDVLARPNGEPRTPREFVEEEVWANRQQVMRILHISKTTFFRLKDDGTIKVTYVGNRVPLVSTDSLKPMVDEEE